jgi:hypothetical protein
VQFVERNSYDPFRGNNRIKTRKTAFSIYYEPKIRFFIEENSKVGAGDFYLWEGKFTLLYQFSSDEYALVIDVPDELGQYFIEVVKSVYFP